MALKTDYQDDVLNTDVNERRKYRMIQNDDGTVSFEDVTAYTTNGDDYGAMEINQQNETINQQNETINQQNETINQQNETINQQNETINQLNASLTEKIIAEVPANTTKTVNFEWSTRLKITFVLMKDKSILRIVSVPTVLFSQKGPDVYLPLGQTAPIITTQPEINYSEYTTIGKSGNVVGAFTSQPTNYTTLYNSKTGTILDTTTASVGLAADLSMADGATINQLSSGFKVTNNTSGTLIIIA